MTHREFQVGDLVAIKEEYLIPSQMPTSIYDLLNYGGWSLQKGLAVFPESIGIITNMRLFSMGLFSVDIGDLKNELVRFEYFTFFNEWECKDFRHPLTSQFAESRTPINIEQLEIDGNLGKYLKLY